MNLNTSQHSALVYSVAVLLFASCADAEQGSEHHGSGDVVHWGYGAANGPDTWGSMDADWRHCAEGRAQSPINLAGAAETELPAVKIDIPGGQEVEVLNQAGVIDALDNGHTIQINVPTSETLTVGDKTYALVQFHFHAPSEHTVDSEHFPMEMHFVHQAEDGALAVVGVLLEEGAENTGIAPLWAQLAEAPGTAGTIRMPLDFDEHVFTGDASGVYHYTGSLTTPPCSEGVSWYIRKTPTRLSKEQINEFTAIYDHNNRPVQALNERTLYLDESPDLAID